MIRAACIKRTPSLPTMRFERQTWFLWGQIVGILIHRMRIFCTASPLHSAHTTLPTTCVGNHFLDSCRTRFIHYTATLLKSTPTPRHYDHTTTHTRTHDHHGCMTRTKLLHNPQHESHIFRSVNKHIQPSDSSLAYHGTYRTSRAPHNRLSQATSKKGTSCAGMPLASLQ